MLDFTEPNTCVGENLTTDDNGRLRIQPWAVPRLVADVRALSGADGKIYETIALPGKLLIDQKVRWRNDTPLSQQMMVRVIRASKSWLVSAPNAIQFRDRWTWAVDTEPVPPITSGTYNSQVGSAIDTGTNTVAEPNPGRQWCWSDVNCEDEWMPYPLLPGSTFSAWYRAYVWTPPPFSDNANKNAPVHTASAGWTRIQLWAFGMQGSVVTG